MNETNTRALQWRPAPTDVRSPNAALMIDFDNVTMGIRSNLGLELRKLLDSDIIRGKVSVQRAYADWRRYPQYIVPLAEASIDLIFAPAYGSSKKNATDIRLAIDALEIVFTRPEIGTFILLSGDSDFSSLVLKLKEYGKYVIGVGMQESSSDLLVQNCDEYYSYNSLSGLTSAAEGSTEKHDPWVLAAKSIRRMVERSDVMRSDRFKQVMLELDPSFNEKSIGFSKFNRFLTEVASRGIISLEKAPNGQYEVAAGPRSSEYASGAPEAGSRPEPSSRGDERRSRPGREQAPSSSERRPRSRRSRGRGRRSEQAASTIVPRMSEPPPEVDEDRLRGAYDLLRSVVRDLAVAGRSVRDSEVKRQMLVRDGQFDEAALGFRKFSRFLRQAHDEEVIDLERTSEGDYLVSPTGAPAPAPGGAETPEQRRREGGRGGRRRRKDAGRQPEPDARPTLAEVTSDAPPVGGHPEPEPELAVAEAASLGPANEAPEPQATPQAAEEAQAAAEAQVVAEAQTAAAPQVQKRRPTLGRFRRGSRGVSRAAAGPRAPAVEEGRPAGEAPDIGRPTPDAARREGPSEASDRELVERTLAYPGVGRRTAEKLVEAFGQDLLDVMDHEPERLSEVLPEHRARAVLEGRRAEREGTGA